MQHNKMTEPPVNSEEEFYMEEAFDEEVEEEQDSEEEIEVNESDTQSDTDVEAEYLRGNPHARRQQIYAKRSGGGSGFARQTNVKYDTSSSEDEGPVVITKTVAEVNSSSLQPEQTDDESMSVRTLMPKSGKQQDDGQSESDLTEVEFELDDDLGAEEMIFSDNEYDDDLATEKCSDDKDDIAISQLDEGEDEGDENDEDEEENNNQDANDTPNVDLVNVADGDDSEMDSARNTDGDDADDMTVLRNLNFPNMKRSHQYHPNLPRKPIVDAEAPLVPKLENIYDDNGEEVYKLDGDEPAPGDPLNVKFLEQQMTQMSEMIMKTFRLSGGSADSSALEQLALATKLMKKHGKPKSSDVDLLEEESESIDTPDTVCSEKLGRRNCRCPSTSEITETEEGSDFLMDECGQGDGLLRYPRQKQPHSARLLSSTPSGLRSETTGYRLDIRRPRSAAPSEVNYKNLGRKSFSFTNPQVREIERQNNILLKKMMNVKPTIKPTNNAAKSNTNIQAKNQGPPVARRSSAAVNRKKYQRQIDLDNDVLKRKLEAVGSRRPIFK
ncbi:protein hemingway [Drosophila hydei]|uniref:Protein hemingway n=1 Tax=Drosophila hydei TaxID=7224 RepID=A0A6J1LD85_DROHY|nr:protein hemingway [Drosophila hydei]